MRIQFACDFDGTISDQDSLRLLLDHYLGDKWSRIREGLRDGSLSERQSLQKAFDLLRVSLDDAQQFVLQNVNIDPHFSEFVNFVQTAGHQILVLSGGLREFIDPLLDRAGLLAALPVRANSLKLAESGRWQIQSYSRAGLCNLQNHCKCQSMLSTSSTHTIYIGDGHTDRCPSERADFVFAKADLIRHCESKALSFEAFSSFEEILSALRQGYSSVEEFLLSRQGQPQNLSVTA